MDEQNNHRNKERETIKSQTEILMVKNIVTGLKKKLIENFNSRLDHAKEKKSANLKVGHLKLPN